MSSVHEEWRAAPGWEGFYEVSSLGRVRSLPRRVATAYGGSQQRPGKLRRLAWTGRYFQVKLSAEGVRGYPTVHSLVAAAFIGPRPAGAQINHIDGDRRNNVAANLEYVSAAENSIHAYRLGLSEPRRGVKSHFASLTENEVRIIRANRAGLTFEQLAQTFGVSLPTIYDILARRSWAHVE